MKTKIILPNNIIDFMGVLKKKGFKVYLVGGAVRNLILGLETVNWDFTTNAKPQKILKLFKKAFYNNKYGTVSISTDGAVFEVTPFRREGKYEDFRHPDKIEWAASVEEDLKRRDFTINAIAYDGEGLIDPEDGLEDLQNKLVRSVGRADLRFSEDALRLVRAIRIATELQFLIEEETRKSIVKNASLITKISGERVRDELFKILKSPQAADGIFFLKNTGLLKYILPEVDDSFDIPQKSPKRHHIYDVGTHQVMALKYCQSTDIITRLATLIHDTGKVKTFSKDKKTELITFYNHEIVGAAVAREIANRLRLSKNDSQKLIKLVRFHMFTVSEKQTDKAIKRFIRNVGKDYLMDILDLRVADRLGSGAKLTSWRTELFKKRLQEVQKEPFKITDLKVTGHDVMKILNIKPGPKVGQILEKIFSEVSDGKLKNERQILLSYLPRVRDKRLSREKV